MKSLLQLQRNVGFGWTNVGVEKLRRPTAKYRGEKKAGLLSLFGKQEGFPVSELERGLRFIISGKPEKPRDYIVVILMDGYVRGGVHIPATNGEPPTAQQCKEARERLQKLHNRLHLAGPWTERVVRM